MRCEEVTDLMNRELDGDLTVEEQSQLKEHLAACAECSLLFERLQVVSFQLRSLPKVSPPINIVDSILPQLEELDNVQKANELQGKEIGSDVEVQDHSTQEVLSSPKEDTRRFTRQSKERKAWTKKRWWIPGSIVAAGLLVVYISSIAPLGTLDNASDQPESGLFITASEDAGETNDRHVSYNKSVSKEERASGQNNEVADGRDAPETETNGKDFDQESNPDLSEEQFEGEFGILDMDGFANSQHAEQSSYKQIYPSADEKYVAFPDNENKNIRINIGENEPYYLTKTSWEKPWQIYSMEWVSDDLFYFVLHNTEEDEYQYWLINVAEYSEEQLNEPYQHGN